MAYTDVFTGSSTSPSDVSYLALAPAGSSTTQLTWPELDGTTPFSRIIRVTPGGASSVIKLPAANLRGPGEDVLFQNVGSNTFAVQDYDGTEVATVAAGTAKYIYLTDNSTDHGAWSAVAFGSGSSATDASQVAGYGMDVVNSKLVVDFAVSANTSGVTVATSDRGKAFVFTAGSVTVALPAVATTTDGFYFGVRNSGTGTVTVDPNGAELVDGASTLAMAPGESALIVCSGAAWYSYGYGRSVAFAITQLTKDLTGLTTLTITAAEAANKMIKFVGSMTANCTVTVPDAASVYFLQNATSVAAAETITFKTSGSGVTLSTGDRQVVYSDGTNVVSATTTTVTAPASVPAGTEGGPSLYFSTDTDTGFYLAGTNSFGITAGGTKRFEVSSTAATSAVAIVAQDDLTVTGDAVFNGTLTVPTSATPAQTAEGSVVWDSDDNLLTVGDGTSRKTMIDDVVFPGLTGTRAWRNQVKAADYTLQVTDNMTYISVTAAATVSGTAATLGNGWMCVVYNGHAAAITIPGSTSLPPGEAAIVICTGSAFAVFPFRNNGWLLLDSDTASSTSVTLTGGSGTLYRSHKLVMQNITLAGDSNIVLRTGNGSIDTGNNYQYTTIRATGSSLSCATSAGTSYIDLTSNPDLVESSGNAFSGSVEILAQTAISRSYFHFVGNFINSAGAHEHVTVSGYYNGGFDRVQVISTAANFSGGSVALYGLR